MAGKAFVIWTAVLAASGLHTNLAAVVARHKRATASISFVQWNVHGECFQKCKPGDPHCDPMYPACKTNATIFLNELLAGKNKLSHDVPDFVGLEEWDEMGLLESSIAGDNWARLTHACGGEEPNGYGVYPFDSASIIFDPSKWDVKSDIIGGCMERVAGDPVKNKIVRPDPKENNYRAFIVQAFKRKSDGTETIVAVAHFPHIKTYEEEIAPLRQAVSEIYRETGFTQVVLVADTNWDFTDAPRSHSSSLGYNAGKSSQSIMDDIYPDEVPGSYVTKAASTVMHKTCCAWEFLGHFDRIIASGFPHAVHPIQTTLLFGDELPPWMTLSMHKPIAGKLTFSRTVPSRALLSSGMHVAIFAGIVAVFTLS